MKQLGEDGAENMGSKQHKTYGARAFARLGLLVLALAATVALAALFGCTQASADDSGQAAADQNQQLSDQVTGQGFTMEDSAVVEVQIDGEGE